MAEAATESWGRAGLGKLIQKENCTKMEAQILTNIQILKRNNMFISRLSDVYT